MIFILNDQNNESQVFFPLLDFCREVRTLSDQTTYSTESSRKNVPVSTPVSK